MTTVELKTKNYTEALRYIQNAAEILSTKAKKDGNYYQDDKYVRMACGTAYSGVLLALDTYLILKNKTIVKKNHQRKSVDDYRAILSTMDKKMLNEYNASYQILHLGGYYDGITKYDVIKSGMNSAIEIINKIKPQGVAGLKTN
jgi:Domain of unknown function (DUF5618)